MCWPANSTWKSSAKRRTRATLIELMTRTRPQAVISDYSMPGDERFGDGIKLISFLRRRFPETRLLVLTMVSNPSLVSAMYAAGAGGVVLKSHGLGSLVQALRVVLADRIYRPTGLLPETRANRPAPTRRARACRRASWKSSACSPAA